MDDDPHNDTALVEKAQNGDEPAFNAIMQRYKRPILDFVYRMTGDPDNAQDVAQMVFVRAWRNLPRFQQRPHARFSTWLFQIARNACIDCIRRRAHDPLKLSSDNAPPLDLLSSATPASHPLSDRELGEHVAAAVAALPEDQRAAIVLSEYEGLSNAEVAAAMKTSTKSVESRLYRARQTLRSRLRTYLE